MSERELEFITRLTREDVAGVIEALVEGLKDGRLKIHKSNDVLELDVPRVIDLEVKAGLSEERAVFAMEVSWRTNRAENPDAPENSASAAPDTSSGIARLFSKKTASKSETSHTRKDKALKKAEKPLKRTSKSKNSGSTEKNTTENGE